MSSFVAGIDAYRINKDSGWVAVVLSDGKFEEALREQEVAVLLQKLSECQCVAIDMPIGLPTDGRRLCDEMAREFVGQRRNSVFYAPIEVALLENSHKEASEVNKMATGHGISVQAYSLRRKLHELEETLKETRAMKVKPFEVHPEVSFREMVNLADQQALTLPGKKSWAGQTLRRRHLERAKIQIPDDGGGAGQVPTDDLLDAAVAAWSADRFRRGEAKSFPESAKPGRRQVIWR